MAHRKLAPIHRDSVKRPALVVTLTLFVAGGVLGAICGLLALTPIFALHALHPSPDDALVSVSDVAPWAAAVGATLGAVVAPTFAWTLLRRAPLWRVVLDPPAGTILGSLAGWLLAFRARTSFMPTLLSLAFLGTVLAAVRLHRQFRMAPISNRETAI